MSLRNAFARLGGLPLAALAAATIGAAAYRKQTLTADGAAAATVVGTLVMARGGIPAAAALVTFFVTASALSRFKARTKARRGVLAQAKGARRDARQVMANGGVATACLTLAGRRGTGAFLGALAAAAADTWATELGLLARTPPRVITTLRRAVPGTSGAVTLQGTLASIAGAGTVGAAWAGAEWLVSRTGPAIEARRCAPGRVALRTAGIAGVLGALVDSFLGATVQAAYWCPACREPSEAPVHPRCGRTTRFVRGWKRIDNDVVNALATTTGALVGAACGAALR